MRNLCLHKIDINRNCVKIQNSSDFEDLMEKMADYDIQSFNSKSMEFQNNDQNFFSMKIE